MRSTVIRLLGVVTVIAAAIAGAAACGATAGASSDTLPSTHLPSPEAAARADSVRQSYTPADVEFMTGMIRHHAQALVMARMAPSHGANATIQVLAERIINGQKGEIKLMQRWLSDRNEPVPQPEPAGTHASSESGDHTMHHMPGMLTAEQLEELDAARGAEFDRLFLTYMIQHHRGALTMVEGLFNSYGAGQGDDIFRIASGIAADQNSEIDRMQSMLAEMIFETPDPL